jgi:hypothetical protein
MPTIPGNPWSREPPFLVGEKLSIYEAAMVYAGRNPCNRFLRGKGREFSSAQTIVKDEQGEIVKDEHGKRKSERTRKVMLVDRGRASLAEYEDFLCPVRDRDEPCEGDKAEVQAHKLSWGIYCELTRRVETGAITPVKKRYMLDGKLDPRDTLIKTVDLVELAAERGEHPEYLAHLMPLPDARKADLRAAPDARIDATIVGVYDNAEAEHRKPPNINQLAAAVQRLLKEQGYKASREQIRDRGAKFSDRRVPAGMRHGPWKNK